jgi:hypothetical protein
VPRLPKWQRVDGVEAIADVDPVSGAAAIAVRTVIVICPA